MIPDDDTAVIDAEVEPKEPVKRGRGRPKGSRNNASKSGPTGQIDPKVQASLHDLVISCCKITNIFLGPQYALQNKEIDDIFQPLERIILRHVPMSGIANPDYVDGAAFLMGIVLYADRIGAFAPRTKSLSRYDVPRQPETVPPNTPGPNASTANGRTGVQSAYPENLLAHFDSLSASFRSTES